MSAERDWAYAMQLLQEIGEDTRSRKKFHARQKLRRAVMWADKLRQLCAEGQEEVSIHPTSIHCH